MIRRVVREPVDAGIVQSRALPQEEDEMRICGRCLLGLGLTIVVPLICQAQDRVPSDVSARRDVVALEPSSPNPAESQNTPARSGGRDSLLNGTLIGFAVGAGLGIAFAHGFSDHANAGDYTAGALIFGGLGAAVGLGLDALFERDSRVFARPPQRVVLSPVVSRRTGTIRFIMRW